eukprot:3069225-Pleurochrysis_carterae.AAC.1
MRDRGGAISANHHLESRLGYRLASERGKARLITFERSRRAKLDRITRRARLDRTRRAMLA